MKYATKLDAWAFAAVCAWSFLVMIMVVLAIGCLQDDHCEADLYCACTLDAECPGFGHDSPRGTCGPEGVCTRACTSDDECDGGVCGEEMVLGVAVCSEAP